MRRIITLLLVLVLASLACSLDFNPPPLSLTPGSGVATRTPLMLQPTLTPTPIPPTATRGVEPVETEMPIPPAATETPILPIATFTPTVLPALGVEQLRNATLTVMGSDQILRTVTLKDGKYEEGTDPTQVGYVLISMGEKVAFGDLNADGSEDAAIIIGENYGGSGVFVSIVAVLNENGQPNAVATVIVDDRPVVNNLAIKNGEIYLDAIVHNVNDPMCCPTLGTMRSYRLVENTLLLSRLTTRTPTGAERLITIDSPANGVEVSSPFVIQGGVTISPFENNLVYSLYLPGTPDPVAQAGFMVNADGLGGPGTFELPLDFSAAGFTGPVRIEIADVSPADGSNLAVCTLFVTLK